MKTPPLSFARGATLAAALAFTLTTLGLAGHADAAGWLQKPRQCYAKLSNRLLVGDGAYTALGLRKIANVGQSFTDNLVSIYGECGVNKFFTATVALSPFGYARFGDNSTFYMGPLMAGLRFGIKRSGSLRIALGLRFGYTPYVGNEVLDETTFTLDDGTAGRAFYQPTVEGTLGEMQLELGYGFSAFGVPFWVSTAAGVRFNGNTDVDHALIVNAQLGATFFKRLVVDLHANLWEPFGADVTETNISGAGQTRYLGFGLTFSYWFLKNLGAFFNFDGVLYARSNAATPSLVWGLETRFGL